MPLWQEFDFECDVMLQDPAREVKTCIDAGASRIVVHAGAASARKALEILQESRGGDFPIEVGVALQAHDTPATLKPYEKLYDYVQVMGIDHIGKQGEPPDPHHRDVKLIRALRKQFPTLTIQADGAAVAHIGELVNAGVNRLVVGSAILRAQDPKAAYKALYTEANAL